MADLLDEDKLEEIKEAFGMFDTEDKGTIPLKDLGTLLRALGDQPTEADLEDTVLQINAISNAVPPPDQKPAPAEGEEGDPPTEQQEEQEREPPSSPPKSAFKASEVKGTLDLKSFLTVCGKRLSKERDKEAELRSAFKMIDKEGTGMINAATLRHIMVTLGEKLDDEDADDMVYEADTDHDGQINWEEFCEILLEMEK
ncbi:calmodulin-alpha-like [Mizuhopecten yessoensis]|uniref:Sulfhydryl light chain n=1 Tax=Mizuhopecten yessoensis TaxID=6573 RepID=A0A210PML4_MIZYE|nr:calmodulin-alpha-like [Mizuhopecten yessoensis]OWF37729.1 Calmodulin [Mizuhopecten yessoensis]